MPFPFQLRRSSSLFNPYQSSMDQSSVPSRGQDQFSNIDFGASTALDDNAPPVNYSPVNRAALRPSFDVNQLNPAPSPLSDRYKKLLSDGPPQRTRPNWQTLVGAGLVGFANGPKAGMEVADRPYNQKVQQYALNKDALGDASKVEGQDETERLRTVMNKFAISDKEHDNSIADANAAQTDIVNKGRLKNWDSMISERDRKAKIEGWQPYTDKTTGHRMYSKIDPNSPTGYSLMDVGKMDESLKEGSGRRVNDANAIGEATLGRAFRRDDRQIEQGEIVKNKDSVRARGVAQENRDANEAIRNARPDTPQQEFQKRALVGRKLVEAKVINENEFDFKSGIVKGKVAKSYFDAVVAGNAIMVGSDGKPIIVPKKEVAEGIKRGYRVVVQ